MQEIQNITFAQVGALILPVVYILLATLISNDLVIVLGPFGILLWIIKWPAFVIGGSLGGAVFGGTGTYIFTEIITVVAFSVIGYGLGKIFD